MVIYTSNVANPYDSSETFREKEYIDEILVKRFSALWKIAGYWITPSMLVDLERDDFDVLHAHAARSFQCDSSVLISKLRHKPSVITAHGSLGSYLGVDLGLRNYMLHVAHNVIAKRVFKAADKVIALNNFEKQHYLRIGVDINKIAIIPNGVSLSEFKKRYYNFKSKYEIEGNIILFVGRLAKIKGLNTLIQAFHLVKRQNFHDTRLVILGEDWGFKKSLLELRKRYHMSSDVLLLDHPTREDIVSAYHACDMVVLPSNYETFSITVLEAFACAKPIIATSVGGILEVVVSGETGCLVGPNDAEALARAMLYLLRNKNVAEKMGLSGERLVTNKFCIERVADEIENLYSDLIFQ